MKQNHCTQLIKLTQSSGTIPKQKRQLDPNTDSLKRTGTW